MRLVGVSAVIALLCACAPASNAPAEAAVAATDVVAASAPASVAAAIDTPPAIAAAGALSTARSEYSRLSPNDCKLTERLEETGDTTHRCLGVAGYVLDMHDSDLRMSLDVIADGGQPQPLEFWNVASGAFSHLGPSAEWRFPQGASQPNALIVRFNAAEQPGQPDRVTSYLLVVRLAASGSCLVAKLLPGSGQNEAARVAADKAQDSTCLKPLS